MYDMVLLALKNSNIKSEYPSSPYYYATIHRPYNTDNSTRLRYVLTHLNNLRYPVKLALHPRTRNRMKTANIPETDFINIQFLGLTASYQYIQIVFSINYKKCDKVI